MSRANEVTREVPVIDLRILAAAERHGEYLGLTEWLEQYISAIEDSPERKPATR